MTDGFYDLHGGRAAFTIFRQPLDFPKHFVVRRFELFPKRVVATPFHRLADTLEDARAFVPSKYKHYPREDRDEPQIVEMWA